MNLHGLAPSSNRSILTPSSFRSRSSLCWESDTHPLRAREELITQDAESNVTKGVHVYGLT